jgi:hypothetical protein
VARHEKRKGVLVMRFVMSHQEARHSAMSAVASAPEGYVVLVEPPKRSGEQNAKFHALCRDIARSSVVWMGKRRTAAEWKVLLVSGHATATKEGSELVPGLEGEFVNLRESTAAMTKRRGSSLIEYTLAFCALHGINAREEVPA